MAFISPAHGLFGVHHCVGVLLAIPHAGLLRFTAIVDTIIIFIQ
jgi:hypothetical protein